MNKEKKYKLLGVVLIAAFFLVSLSIFSYTPNDLPFLTSNTNPTPHNYISYFGAYLAFGVIFILGRWGAYLLPLLLIFWAINLFTTRKFIKPYITFISVVVLFGSFSTLGSLLVISSDLSVGFQRGGLCGVVFSEILLKYFGFIGGIIVGSTLIAVSLLLSTEMLLIPYVIKGLKYVFKCLVALLKGFFSMFKRAFSLSSSDRSSTSTISGKSKAFSKSSGKRNKKGVRKKDSKRRDKSKTWKKRKKEAQIVSYLDKEKKEKRKISKPSRSKKGYKLPPLELLNSSPDKRNKEISQNLEENIYLLEETLQDFGIEAKVVNVEHGPVVTLYEVEPAPGVKIQRIANLSDDIALVMKAHDVRVVAPIPGKGTVGIEIPNPETTFVYLKEMLKSEEYRSAESKLTLAVGKDVTGESIVSDLREMPHLLIAGATGSGKTVCINSIVMSILFNATPEEVNFIMIDPKKVELVSFSGLPHLLAPIVTNHKKVSGVLNWIIEEMERRYQSLAKVGVRDIHRYNSKIENHGISVGEQEGHEKLPYIVLIIDELADLMSIASKEIEDAITRLAQLSRAVGIHMILATQRPSVDVITGTIKANFPGRISFKVASKVDSRTVLDVNGAEKLLGQGDMLFLKPGSSKLTRVQGSLVSDKEVEKVVSFIKKQWETDFEEEILEKQKKQMTHRGFKEDKLYDDAVKVVLETQQASASMLQRRLRVGYTRAARLIDMMEEEGIVGPHRGSKAREILVDIEKFSQEDNF